MSVERAARARKSYTTHARSPVGWVRDRYAQYRHARATMSNLGEQVAAMIESERQRVEAAEANLGITLRGRRVLEVGHGQLPWRLAYLAQLGNSATGIDLELVPRGPSPAGYYRLWRTNGLERTVKTLGKELLGFRRAFEREFCRQLGLSVFPDVDLLQMDAAEMAFSDHSFDYVCSSDVFEHLPEPERAAREISRVMKPGGAATLSFVHYAWFNALHDLRLITGPVGSFPLWAHLRESVRDRVQQGAYVNDLRVDDWLALFSTLWPGSRIHRSRVDDPRFLDELERARRQGELEGFEDDELLTDRIQVYWRKP